VAATVAQHSPAWLDEFDKYGPVHFITIACCATLIAGLCLLARRWKHSAPRRERILRIAWVVALILGQGFTQVWWLLPDNFELGYSLPLHFCDLAPWFAPFALLLHARFTQTMLYFWGLALSSWAFIAPILTAGPAHGAFWLFWLGHSQIIGSAVYSVAVDAYRPGLRDVAVAALLTLAYNITILLGLNMPGPLSPLGPWPWRAPLIILGEWLLFVLLWLPFALTRRRGRPPDEVLRAASHDRPAPPGAP